MTGKIKFISARNLNENGFSDYDRNRIYHDEFSKWDMPELMFVNL